jgi:site-specific DNA recombinase
VVVNHNKFLGYDKDGEGNLIINEKQAKIVRRIYTDYID